jgi:hypothetical protein
MADINSPLYSGPRGLAFGNDRRAAPRAPVDRAHARDARRKLEMRFLAILETCWAKPMRGFRAADRWLEHVSRYPTPHALQFIPLLLSFPASKLFNFCFQRRYLIQLRQLRLLGLDELAESLAEVPRHLIHLSGDQLRVALLQHRLGDVDRRANACLRRFLRRA